MPKFKADAVLETSHLDHTGLADALSSPPRTYTLLLQAGDAPWVTGRRTGVKVAQVRLR